MTSNPIRRFHCRCFDPYLQNPVILQRAAPLDFLAAAEKSLASSVFWQGVCASVSIRHWCASLLSLCRGHCCKKWAAILVAAAPQERKDGRVWWRVHFEEQTQSDGRKPRWLAAAPSTTPLRLLANNVQPRLQRERFAMTSSLTHVQPWGAACGQLFICLPLSSHPQFPKMCHSGTAVWQSLCKQSSQQLHDF